MHKPSKILYLDEDLCSLNPTETRVPWNDFPPVFIFSPLYTAQNHEFYEKAKKESGFYSALQLVKNIVSDSKLNELKRKVSSSNPLVVPVQAQEEFGLNMIPAAFAFHVANMLGLDVCDDIFMANMPMRTGKSAFYRLLHYPVFTGKVNSGQQYIIADDTLVMGGTLTSLRGYIENEGGTVIQAIALTGLDAAASLNIKDNMLKAIYDKHGEELNEWWKTKIGFAIDKLTQGEAEHLKKAPNVEEIRTRINEHEV